jgi:transcriptional regulator with XRE-family HTH domain
MARETCLFLKKTQDLMHYMDGSELRSLRHGAHCTQEELGFILDLHPTTISDYERNAMPIPQSIAILVRLLSQLVPILTIFCET